MWILLLFWYGSSAGQLQKIENIPTESACKDMKTKINSHVDANVHGRFSALCIRKPE